MAEIILIIVIILFFAYISPKKGAAKKPQSKRGSTRAPVRVQGTGHHALKLPSISTPCVGSIHYIGTQELQELKLRVVVAFNEFDNPHDRNAVVIKTPEGRKIGYLSAGQARLYAGPIRELGKLYMGANMDGVTLMFDLPRLTELRQFVARGGYRQ